jgi:hypothetical protein
MDLRQPIAGVDFGKPAKEVPPPQPSVKKLKEKGLIAEATKQKALQDETKRLRKQQKANEDDDV